MVIKNIVIMQNFGVMFGRCNMVGLCTSGNYMSKWVTKLYNI
jgi:hypothetical protein